MRLFLVAVFLVAGNPLYVPPIRQAAQRLDYDSFCKLPDVAAKRAAFQQAAPETRAELVRTPIERWRDANRARLSEAQLAFLTEFSRNITALSYTEGPKGDEERARVRPLADKARQLLPQADMQAMQPDAPCIPKA